MMKKGSTTTNRVDKEGTLPRTSGNFAWQPTIYTTTSNKNICLLEAEN